MPFILAQSVPVEPILAAPSGAVVGLIAVVAVLSLALALRQLLLTKKNGNGHAEHVDEHERLWKEIDTLRRRSHRHANVLAALTLKARLPPIEEPEE